MDTRMGCLEGRVDEQSNMLQEFRASFRHLDDKLSRYFMWLVGIQITTLVAVIVKLLSNP